MNFIKKHKLFLIASIVVVISLSFLIILNVKGLFTNLGVPVYGKRIDATKEIKINSNRRDEISNRLMTEDNINNVIINVKGAIINIIIDVNKEVDLIEAKNLGLKALIELTDDEKKVYDIQLFVTQEEVKEEEDKLFPIIGYKSRLSTTLVWQGNN